MNFPITLSINNTRELEILRHAIETNFDIENDTVFEDSGLYASQLGEPVVLSNEEANENRKATGVRMDRVIALAVLRERLNNIKILFNIR